MHKKCSAKNRFALVKAVDSRDFEQVKMLLQKGLSPNIADEYGTPVLNCTLYENVKKQLPDEKIVFLLLEAGAEPDKPDDTKVTPLMLACKFGFKKVVKFLLERKVNVNAKPSHGIFTFPETPLSIAAGGGHREIVQMLVKAGAKVNQKFFRGMTPLTSAANSGDITIVRELIAAGAKGTGAELHSPIFQNRLDIVLELLAAGADVNYVEPRIGTILEAAVQSENIEIVKAIIKAGAKLDDVTSGRTPLIFAVCKQKLDLIELLLKAGADVDARDIYKCTALIEAAGRENSQIVARLLKAGANPKLKMENGNSAIDLAKSNGRQENLNLLLRP